MQLVAYFVCVTIFYSVSPNRFDPILHFWVILYRSIYKRAPKIAASCSGRSVLTQGWSRLALISIIPADAKTRCADGLAMFSEVARRKNSPLSGDASALVECDGRRASPVSRSFNTADGRPDRLMSSNDRVSPSFGPGGTAWESNDAIHPDADPRR